MRKYSDQYLFRQGIKFVLLKSNGTLYNLEIENLDGRIYNYILLGKFLSDEMALKMEEHINKYGLLAKRKAKLQKLNEYK